MLEIENLLRSMCNKYEAKRQPEEKIKIEFKIAPDQQIWSLIIVPGSPIKLSTKEIIEPQITFITDHKTLNNIYNGTLTGLTAMGRENLYDKTPLDFKLNPNTNLTAELMDKIYYFVIHFFNPTLPERTRLDKTNAILVHGAWAIPMFYHSGFRSAWYQIDKGQTLNKPDDTNPFPQAFIILSGQGYAKIGEITIPIQANNAYYIPPNSVHIIWTENEAPIKLLYLAWGDKA